MPPQLQPAWSRRHLLIVAGIVAVAGVLLLAGLGYGIWSAINTPNDAALPPVGPAVRSWSANSDGVRGEQYRNQVAAEQMLQARPADLEPAPPTLKEPARIVIGPSTDTGPAGVPAGFDHTPSGALGQLAALEVATLAPMSLQAARTIFDRWAMVGVRFDRWELAQAIRSFHASAGTVDGDASVTVIARPVGAQIKGVDGPDWVLACVQLDVAVTVIDQTRFGYGHCERMQWDGRRWMIGPGEPPATAPSTWPGSGRSLAAGWRTWVDQEPDGGAGR